MYMLQAAGHLFGGFDEKNILRPKVKPKDINWRSTNSAD
jgi:hypothetical protein